MLGFSASNPTSPTLERTLRNVAPHKLDHLSFVDTELGLYGFKRGAVFPSHFDDAADIGF